ncbi:hypothetical protein WSM22_35790 [Cytophagales bacterium WSM2-2]|nr:hypothetical protein WSM22_35790 [Cytophagales bacterium WSM2-2]
MTCKNCSNNFEGKFCNECGQPASTHDLNFHFLVHDIQHGLFHLDKGFLFTIKELFTRPGHMIREYLRGKRVSHFKPVSLILILAGAYGLLSHFFHIDILNGTFHVSGSKEEEEEIKQRVSELSDWVASHYALVSLLSLPVFTLGIFIGFWKKGYNLAEYFVLNAYLTGQHLLIHILFFPVIYLLNATSWQESFNVFLNTIIVIVTLWTLLQFFDHLKKWTIIWRTVMSFLISAVIYIMVGIILMLNVLSSLKAS